MAYGIFKSRRTAIKVIVDSLSLTMSQRTVCSNVAFSASADLPGAPKRLKPAASLTVASVASSPPDSDSDSSASDVVELSDDELEKPEANLEQQLGKYCKTIILTNADDLRLRGTQTHLAFPAVWLLQAGRPHPAP